MHQNLLLYRADPKWFSLKEMTSLVTFPAFIRYSVSFQQPAFFCMTGPCPLASLPSHANIFPVCLAGDLTCNKVACSWRLLAKMYQPQEHGYFGASPVLSHATCGWLIQKMFPRMTFALLAVVSANYFLSFRSCVGKQTNLVVLTAFCFLSFQALCLWQPAECPNSFFWVGGSCLFLLQ